MYDLLAVCPYGTISAVIGFSCLNIDHSRDLPVEICGINYTEEYTNL